MTVAYGIRKVRMQHRRDDPMRMLIEEHNKLVDDVAAGRTGGTETASKIVDQEGKDVDGNIVT